MKQEKCFNAMKTKFIFILVLSLTALHCKPHSDCTNDPPTETHLSAEDLSYFNFPVGAWWLFENDSTGARDSVYVVGNINFVKEIPDQEPGCIFAYEDGKKLTTFSPFFNFQIIHTLQAANAYSYATFEFGGAGHTSFRSPEYSNQPRDTLFYKVGQFDSVIFSGHHFFEVTEFFTSIYSFGPPDYKSYFARFWYAKNIGLIKWELEDSDTCWTVVSYGGL